MGIDIEAFNKRVLNVRQKFLNDGEQAWIPSDDVTANMLAWDCKGSYIQGQLDSRHKSRGGINLDRFAISSDMPIRYKGHVIALEPYILRSFGM